MAGLQLLEPAGYLQALVQSIPKAKQRVVLAAMVVLSGGKVNVVFDELLAAAKRGVRVTILLDAYTGAFFRGFQDGRTRWRETKNLFKELEAVGGRVYMVGKIGVVPYRGRCHAKITVIDDVVYSFGGMNFHYEQFSNRDFMLSIRQKNYADCVAELVERIGRSRGAQPNGQVEIDSQNTILFDGGQTHDSIIYQKACELAAQAERACVVSQMTPSGELATLLADINTTYYTNHPNQMEGLYAIGQAFDLQRFRIPNSYTRRRYIHAKFILFEMPGGRKALISGSNNFSYRGVAFGTKEIAIYSTDETLWRQLYHYMETEIQNKRRS